VVLLAQRQYLGRLIFSKAHIVEACKVHAQQTTHKLAYLRRLKNTR
jgi:hypothetical protein